MGKLLSQTNLVLKLKSGLNFLAVYPILFLDYKVSNNKNFRIQKTTMSNLGSCIKNKQNSYVSIGFSFCGSSFQIKAIQFVFGFFVPSPINCPCCVAMEAVFTFPVKAASFLKQKRYVIKATILIS